MRIARVVAYLSAWTLAGCVTSLTLPVAVITPTGDVLRGENHVTLSKGEFTVTGIVSGKPLQCYGTYDPLAQGPTISIAATCSDGRKGIGRALRDSATSGSGKIELNDGTVATFVYGAAASGI
jgi:hypothetical protein